MKDWIAGARPRTLPAALVPVLVGTAAAAGMNGDTNALKGLVIWRFAAALVVSLALQIGVNYANDYSDGIRGTDADRVGPMRLTGSGRKSPGAVKRAAFLSFGVAAVAGLGLAAATSWWLIAVGLVAIAAAWFYTGGPRPYGYAGLGEVFVFVFFGIVATTGSAFVQIERVTPLTLLVSIPVGLFATALLVVNNLRDIPGDTEAGKRTLAVRLGDKRTRIFYIVLVVLPFFTVPFLCGLSQRPAGAFSMFAVLLARKPVQRVIEGARGPALIPVLGATGKVQLAFGVLISVGLFIGG
ncbi:MAG: 1,4-dihydroxy-2-naphthoate polyprenyltransferase [Actinobacteria bacterium]|jgi:1,4-dihydroxy-2-naphthoate octaprenyltransferase|nr:1,4-dihydroxy-2-naphthoate polyprenyltransferase [Actinomycetes bacterium]MCX6506593.1 1,4-dihydroxy-2-naphthoate polyprenyltransferase [Actinomycetota bacterium]